MINRSLPLLSARTIRTATGVAASIALLTLASCESTNDGSRRTTRLSGAASDAAIMVDGVVDDWPIDSVLTADADHIYIRFLLEGEPRTLQASNEMVSIRLDLDNDDDTGMVFSDPIEATTLGVDLEIQLSPADATGATTGGCALIAYEDGEATPLTHHDVGFHFAPTFASTWFEARISRHPDGKVPLPNLDDAGEASGMVVLMGPSGAPEAWSTPFTGELPRAGRAPALADLAIPPKPRGAIRVVSWNVLFTAPATNPQPFARVLRALDADVILLQEWIVEDPINIRSWFNATLPRESSWEVLTGDSWGVAMVSPYPIRSLGENSLYLAGETERAVNAVMGVVETPQGDVAAASVHLKCCGGPDGPEEARRVAEAALINETLGSLANEAGLDVRVLAGDLNLVGTSRPLEALRAGLDADGSDLEVARAVRLGDAAMYTWRDAASAFSPGRLDYALVGGSGADLLQAFSLDVAQLTANAITANRLRAGDTSASDHLPVVVDIRPN